MFETLVKLKPRERWHPGLTPEQLRTELDSQVRLPGLANSWLPPIGARIDMLSTGMRSMLGIKLVGPDLQTLQGSAPGWKVSSRPCRALHRSIPSARRAADIFRSTPIAAARYGLNVDDVHDVSRWKGARGFPINIRYPQEWRDSVERLRALPIVVAHGPQIVLSDH